MAQTVVSDWRSSQSIGSQPARETAGNPSVASSRSVTSFSCSHHTNRACHAPNRPSVRTDVPLHSATMTLRFRRRLDPRRTASVVAIVDLRTQGIDGRHSSDVESVGHRTPLRDWQVCLEAIVQGLRTVDVLIRSRAAARADHHERASRRDWLGSPGYSDRS